MTNGKLCTCIPVRFPGENLFNIPNIHNIKFTKVTVANPITHNSQDRGRYTSYEVRVDTNDIAFSLPNTCVRRRFSEFEWLLRVLKKNHRVDCPVLPSKNWFSRSGRFHPDVIERRRAHFQTMLNALVEEAAYLSDPALHLFLQTTLSVENMTRVLEGRAALGVQETVLSQAPITSIESINRDSFMDRTKKDTFGRDDVTSINQSQCGVAGHVDDMGVVIDLPRDVRDDVTRRHVTDDSVDLTSRYELSSSDSDYLSCSAEPAGRRRGRRVSFQQDFGDSGTV